MTKHATLIAIGACFAAIVIAGLSLSSSARVTIAGAARGSAGIDPNAMMARSPRDLPVLAHPIH